MPHRPNGAGAGLPRLLAALCTAALFVPAAVAAAPARPQATAGLVVGTVVDAQGGVLPSATVVLTNQTQGTKTRPIVTNGEGIFIVPSVGAGRYTLEVILPGFQTFVRKNLDIAAGERVVVDRIVLQVGAARETVDVRAEDTTLQITSGERSSVVESAQLEELPIQSHDFLQFVSVLPGVNAVTLGTGSQEGRLGGGGQDNVLIDGVSVMDTGNNGLMGGLNLPVAAIAEVKVITSGGGAEVGRSSGLRIQAVTKSGTNKFTFSLYDYDRNSALNANSWANAQNGRPKGVSHQGDFGFVFAGPIGRPGGNNKLFFAYSQELRPRSAGNGVNDFRVPTALERVGDFSQTRDNNGALFNLIYDASTGLPKSSCSSTVHTACFQDGGLLGKIPMNRLYGPGLALINQYPLPNVAQTSGTSFNYEITTPVQRTLGYTPAVRIDYQVSPRLRVSGRWAGASSTVAPTINLLPGFDETLQKFPLSQTVSGTATYYVNPVTVLEATYGVNQNRLGAPPVSPYTNRTTIVCPAALAATVSDCALGSLASLFPNAGVVDPRYYEYGALGDIGAPFFQNGQILLPPQIAWAASGTSSRISGAPPSLNFPGFMNINRIQNVALSVTRVMGTHTAKAGLQIEHSYKAQNFSSSQTFQGALNFGTDTNNALDAGFPYANAALGVFSSYAQQSKFLEGRFLYNGVDWFVQDNWKANAVLTIDYGLRFVHQQPLYDAYGQTSNFFPDRWTPGQAPLLYRPGCAGASPCVGTARQAVDPRTSALLGPGTSGLIGQTIPGSGDPANGLVQAGHGIATTAYQWPALAVAPRFGIAYNGRGPLKLVLRGSVGLYFDRPDGNSVFGTIANPPVATGSTAQWGLLSNLAANPTLLGPVPTLRVYQYDSKLPSDVQWNAGAQMALPWASSLDVSYVGHHAYNVLGGQQAGNAVDLNTIDLGTTVAAANQDPTQPAGTALPNNLLRGYRGYGNVFMQWGRFHRTYHSVQTTYSRRFRKDFSAGLSWTWSLSDRGNTNLPGPQLRLSHNPDGSFVIRADQATAESLFADQGTTRHIMTANFVWTLPRASFEHGLFRHLNGVLSNWQLSGVYRADSGAPYDVTYSYSSGGGTNLTGSPDYTARILVNGNRGSGCSGNQYAQFKVSAFSGPLPGSTGLESGRNLLHGCKDHRLDVAIQRSINIGHGRQLQLRIDLYNVLNTVIYTGRVTTVQLTSPANQTVQNSQYLASGAIDPNRLTPLNAGFGAATAAAGMRSSQVKLTMKF